MSSHSSPASPPASPLLAPHRHVNDPVLTARALTKVYGRGTGAVTALDSVDVDIPRARFTAVMGPSGSGKSTLMHCLAGLDSVTSGTIMLDGDEVSAMSQRRLTRLRRERIGFIFQSFNLVPTLTAAENITLPLDIARQKVDRQRFDQVVEAVGLSDRLSHRPAELSGGQVQRVACARALVGKPAVVFADEPTGNLDSHSTQQVLAILRTSVDELDQSVVMVTHEPEAAAWADTVLFLRDGHVVAELADPSRDHVLDALRELGEDRQDQGGSQEQQSQGRGSQQGATGPADSTDTEA
ncbi:ABC transporter ATP-binding protein [Actinomyces wuliandei]|uniref:ABC transporter ATP-binding protein n=1 Tax=Actinomyces wuliandei TaxID=2057743 RepID=UPI0011181A9A|nr:ABC transporter ATP-binding protein [Actinomyces wuliandei]